MVMNASNLSLALFLLSWPVSTAAAAYDCDRILRRDDGAKFELLFAVDTGTDEELRSLCLRRVPLLKEYRFRDRGIKQLTAVRDTKAREVGRSVAGEEIVVVDIETWPTRGDDRTVADSQKRLGAVIRAIKAEAPDSEVGLYSMVPVRDYYRAVLDPSEDRYKEWQAENDRLRPLAEAVDALFPSVYTFFDEAPARWRRYAHANISEARRLAPNKLVYPFIWDRYHKTEEPIQMEFLHAQFSMLFDEPAANGAVIWLKGHEPWDTQSTWYQALKEFLDDRSEAAEKS